MTKANIACIIVAVTLAALPAFASIKASTSVGQQYVVSHGVSIPLELRKDGDLLIAGGGGDMYYTGYRGSSYNSQIVAVNLTLQKQVCSFGGGVRGAQYLRATSDGKYVIASHQVISTGGSTGTFYVFNSTCDLLHTQDGYDVDFINDTHVLYTDSYYTGGVERKTRKALLKIPECITLPKESWLRPNSVIPGRSIQNNYPENRYHVYDRTAGIMVDMYTNSTISKFEGDTAGGQQKYPGAYYHGFDSKYYYFTDVSTSGVLGYLEMWGRDKISKLIHKLPTPYPLVISGCSSNVYSPALAPQVSDDDTTVTFLNGYCFSESDAMTVSIPQNGSIVSTTILGSGNAVLWKKRIVAWGTTNFTVSSYPGSMSVVNTSVGVSGHEKWVPPQSLGNDTGLVMSWNNVEGNGRRACELQVRSLVDSDKGELVFSMKMPNPGEEYIQLVSDVLPSIQTFVITAHDKAEVFTWKLKE